MNKDYKIGDRVNFLKSNDFGIVKTIISERKLEVEDSSGFLSIVNKTDLIPFNKSTNSVSSYGDLNFKKDKLSKDQKKIKIKSNLNVLKLDLHIENLISDYHLMTNAEIINIQVKKCEDILLNSINSNIHKLVIVHGIGEGVLKKEVHNLLKRYKLRYFESLNGGSTDVMI
tara:strand:+ start:982 stop:1494 length:513 start_codon:yes stop_codon:yes gene_type:complete